MRSHPLTCAAPLSRSRAPAPSPHLSCALALLGALPACHRVEAIERPPNAGARAVLLIAATDTRALAVRALDPELDTWAPLSTTADTTLYAVSFSCPLARLGLVSGPLVLADGRATDPLTPPPAAVYQRVPGRDGDATWTASPDVPLAVADALDRLPLPASARCHAVAPSYTADPVDLPRDEARGPPSYGIALADGRVLAGTRNDNHFVVERDGTVRQLAGTHRDKHLRGGARAPDGSLWMVGDEGAVWHGDLEGELALVTTTTSPFDRPQQRIAVVVAGEGAPFELYAAIESADGDIRTLVRYDGAGWTELARFAPLRNTIFFPALAWLGPQHVVAIGVHPDRLNGVVRYQSGRVSFEELPATDDGPASILHHPALGTLVGRDGSGITRYQDRHWDEMLGVLPLHYVRVMIPEGDGFMYVGSPEVNFTASAFSHWHPSIGFCRTSESYTDFATGVLVPLGTDTLVALTLSDFTAPMGITLLRRTQGPASCSTPE